jgi:hypothetical protein
VVVAEMRLWALDCREGLVLRQDAAGGFERTVPLSEVSLMVLDIFFLEMPEGGWIAKCDDHAAWKFKADTFAEAKAKAPTSLKRHHSRQLQFRFFIVGSVGT